MDRLFTALASRIAFVVGQPTAFVGAVLIVLFWALSGPLFGFSDTWQLVINTGTTILTFLIVFLIQNSQNRDAAAMEAKLDELLRAVDKARGAFIGIEHLTDKQIEEIRAALENEAGSRKGDSVTKAPAEESVDRLLDRY
jgi:low affinity Fe/Cu permease